MQSFRSFGLLLEEQWPALGPKNGRTAVFRSMDHPTNDWIPLQRASNFACGGLSTFCVVWRRLFGRLTRQGGAMAGFRPFRNDNLGQNSRILGH